MDHLLCQAEYPVVSKPRVLPDVICPTSVSRVIRGSPLETQEQRTESNRNWNCTCTAESRLPLSRPKLNHSRGFFQKSRIRSEEKANLDSPRLCTHSPRKVDGRGALDEIRTERPPLIKRHILKCTITPQARVDYDCSGQDEVYIYSMAEVHTSGRLGVST